MLGDPAEVAEFRPVLRTGGIWLALFGAVAFGAVAVLMALHPRNGFDVVIGVLSSGFCALAAVVLGWRLARPRSVVFSSEGLEFPSLVGRRRIAWSNVRGVGIWRQGMQAINSLWLADTAEVDRGGYGILRGANRMLGAGDVSLGWADRDRGAEEFDALLQAWIGRYGGAAVGDRPAE